MSNFDQKPVLVLLYAVIVLFFSRHLGVENVVINSTVYLVGPIAALVAGLVTLRHLGFTGKRAAVLKCILTATGFWFFAELTTLYFQSKGTELSPTVIDVFFFVGYVLFSAAVVREAKLFGLQWRKISPQRWFFLISVLLLVVGAVGYSAIRGYDVGDGILMTLAKLSWSIGDLIMGGLSLFLLAMAWEYQGGRVRREWMWFIGATLANLIPDVIYNVSPTAIADGSPLNAVLNSFWVGGYFLIAAYFVEMDRELRRIQSKISN